MQTKKEHPLLVLSRHIAERLENEKKKNIKLIVENIIMIISKNAKNTKNNIMNKIKINFMYTTKNINKISRILPEEKRYNI